MRKILLLSRFFTPGYKAGGALRTVSNIVETASPRVTFHVITSDRDLGDESAYQNVPIDTWVPNGHSKVMYSSRPVREAYRQLKRERYDGIYLNSFFSFRYSIVPLILAKLVAKNTRILLAPRGEFSRSALKIRKTKKRIYLFMVRQFSTYATVHWHASAQHESDDIRRVLAVPEREISTVPDILALKNFDEKVVNLPAPRDCDALKICCISRVSKMKNIEFSISVISRLTCPAVFTLAGPAEDKEYLEKCLNLTEQLPENIKFEYVGALKNHEVLEVFSNNHVFLLPTLGENFGHVIIESLSVGTPVLISNQTPWRDLEKLGVGWDLPIKSETNFVSVLENLFEIPEDNYYELRRNAYLYAVEISGRETVAAMDQLLLSEW